ncbi:sel1 repeat family protein [Salmonella enterica subsp. enterica serovar Panama]|nr:sel1 repeat family protein [Salmonella enterica subsp. enterica serovar Panama]
MLFFSFYYVIRFSCYPDRKERKMKELNSRYINIILNNILLFILFFCLWDMPAYAVNSLWPACDAIKKTIQNANQGDRVAQKDLADCYYIGKGVGHAFEAAAKWYLKSAEQGYAPSQYWLGKLYMSGHGVEKSDQKSFMWMKRAAEQNYIPAIVNVATMYHSGQGVAKNHVQGTYWTRRAAELGSPGDQKLLGLLYEKGVGVPEDLEKAKYWYSKAANQRKDISEALSAQRYLDALNQKLMQEHK